MFQGFGQLVKTFAQEWLKDVNPAINMKSILSTFINHKNSFSHSRHYSIDSCRNAGLNVVRLEDNQELQDAVLSLHHCYMILMDKYPIVKIIENQINSTYAQNAVVKN